MGKVLQKRGDSTVTVQIDRRVSSGAIFSPTPIGRSSSVFISRELHSSAKDQAPEKSLTLFALRLAVLEKAASGLGAISFAWATVVLLGGFAGILRAVDFWFITVMLLIEGARIFGRSHELAWQHQSTWASDHAGIRRIKSTLAEFKSSFRLSPRDKRNRSRKRVPVASPAEQREYSHSVARHDELQRTWKSTEVSLLPYTGWFTLSKNISRLLHWLQLLSAMACVVLSLMRLIKQDYVKGRDPRETRNMTGALNIFYGLALAEALLFLLEKAYWEWKVSSRNVLVEVNKACGFKDTQEDMVHIKRFFYDAYSRCVEGSIFDGLKMDLVSFAEELLGSDSSEEQLIGARILLKFVTEEKFTAYTLRKIGTSTDTMERLVDMLTWKYPAEEELRMAAANIVLKLAGKKQNALRVAEIPGSIVSIGSLLYTGPTAPDSKLDELSDRRAVPDRRNYEFSAFNLLGLRILKKLAHDHENCAKIGNTRELLPKVVDFTGNGKRVLGQPNASDTQIDCMRYALLLLKMLSRASGDTGRALRHEISENIFSVSNLRDVLRYGQKHMLLQKLAIEIITNLGMEEEGTDRIGSTGGIVRELFGIFFSPGGAENLVRAEAGEALMMLTMESEANCGRVLRIGQIRRLVEALDDPFLMKSSARILRNLCAYGGPDHVHRLRGLIGATPTVLRKLIQEENKMLAVMIGLATQIFKLMSPEEALLEFEKAGIKEGEVARKLVKILRENREPCIEYPRMRWFVVELAIWLMESGEESGVVFRKEGLKVELENVAETTSELEFFQVFSGCVGMSRHPTTMHALVDRALEILGRD